MAIRLIALDIDGTLLDSRWQLPEANRAAIAEATRRGIEVALVTGRRYDFAMTVAHQLDSTLTMIVSNGALIRSKDGHTHLRHLLPKATAQQVLHLTSQWREGAAVIFDRERENQLMLETLDPDDSLRYAYYSRNLEYIGLARPLESCLTEDPIQVMLSGGIAAMQEAEARLRDAAFAEEFRLAVTAYAIKDFAMIDVIPRGCSKGSTLAEWAALRGIAREEILAIGDNHNDLEMLSFAGIPVVMGNSVAELKTYGWHETGTNDENGVALAIEKFALREAASLRVRRSSLLLPFLLLAAPALRAEYVVLRSGQRLTVTGYQLQGDKYRLQMKSGFVEVAADDVVAIEPEDVFSPEPAKPIVAPPYRELVDAAAARYSVDADLITSVIAVESNFDPKAVSRKNARGLMQLLPETAARLGVKNIDDPQENIDGGTRYLRELLQKYNNDLVLTLAAYNAGPERVQQYGRVPPFAETISYVRRVRRSYEKSKSESSKKTPAAKTQVAPGAGNMPTPSLPRTSQPQ